MALTIGTQLGPYTVTSLIGKGGMGEVCRAHDTRLNRDVAIKSSGERFTERFEREARAIAALNHPNICHLYDVGPNYLVMELVEGPTLAEYMKQGPIPYEEALNIARQIADALEAAHEKGIVHRDLKPGNIKIKPDGIVKVLDFGLAKAGGTPALRSDESPTLNVDQTEAGVILGTASYMSPEQAKGKSVDQRADIYAFGAVLYEMLTGERLHDGESITEVLASVIKEQPSWEKVPSSLQRLLGKCLEKDPQKRLRHIGDVMLLVDDTPAARAIPVPSRKPFAKAGVWAVVVILIGSVVTNVLWNWWRTPPAAMKATRFQIPLPEKGEFGGYLLVSPDGRKVAFNTTGSGGGLWVRDLDTLEPRLLPQTENGSLPFGHRTAALSALLSEISSRKSIFLVAHHRRFAQ
jgi:serine/threonine-protein kinase